ncbi:MAG TPA: zf-HC2 domain-containing protein [Kofleriaceae bacterium]|nr:zf-HC2 domain-containing protein [Kofleriaceae bacterium]
MSLCTTIDTLAMAYLDDELAAQERYELETHLTECASCRSTLERERADRSMIRRALAVPATPDLLRAKISRSLDEADRADSKEQRRRWSSYLLPSSAIAAAAAAIALFVGGQMPASPKVANVAQDAVKLTSRSLPLEVQGASTGPWVQQHFAEDVRPPTFVEPELQENDSQLLGARLAPNGINGHDAAMMQWQVRLPGKAPFLLFVVAVNGINDDEMRDGTPVRVNDRTLFVFETKDQAGHAVPVVSYVAPNRLGWMFVAPELSANDLISLASRVNLVAPQ